MDEVIEKCAQPGSREIDKHYYKVKGMRLDFDGEGRLIPINEIEQENGVTNHSIPAIHTSDGPVIFMLEYAVLKIVFDDDTYPDKCYIWHLTGEDIELH